MCFSITKLSPFWGQRKKGNSCLLNTFCKPGIVLRDLCRISHLILTLILRDRYYFHLFIVNAIRSQNLLLAQGHSLQRCCQSLNSKLSPFKAQTLFSSLSDHGWHFSVTVYPSFPFWNIPLPLLSDFFTLQNPA